MGVPVRLGRQGIEQVITLQLTSEEMADLHNSAKSIQKNIVNLNDYGTYR